MFTKSRSCFDRNGIEPVSNFLVVDTLLSKPIVDGFPNLTGE